MKKSIFILFISIHRILFSQCPEETKILAQIVTAFETLNEMILTDDKLDQLYIQLSYLNYSDSTLLTIDEYGVVESRHLYGNKQLLSSENFMKDGISHMVRVSIDSTNLNSKTRHHTNTQINISLICRNDSGLLYKTILNIHMRSGIIVWIYEMDNIPVFE
jgi:hypothetical protein